MNYFPQMVVWEVTWRCNAKCIHCGSDCVSIEKNNELSTSECLKIIDDLAAIGTKKIAFSGGDPLLRKDLFILACYAKEKGILPGFITNGIAFNDEMLDEVEKINPFSFGISLDAGESYIHDYIRGHKGCYEHALVTLLKLRLRNLNASVVTTVHKLNYSQLPKIRDILIGLGVKMWQIQYADYIGRTHRDTMITEAQYLEIAKFIKETQKNFGTKIWVSGADVFGYMNGLSTEIAKHPWQGCQAGMYVLGLGSDGTIRGCLSQQIDKYIEGNIRDVSLVDIWNNPNSFAYNRNFDKSCLGGYCSECQYADTCRGGCTRAATTETDCRCTKYCLHKIEQCGFTDEYNSRKNFAKEEIADIYNNIKSLPDEFYNRYNACEILGNF